MGRMTREPETKTTTSGTTLTRGAIAVDSYAGKDAQGNRKTRTLFLDWVAFGATAEVLSKHFPKGRAVILTGELTLQTWEKDGVKRYKHEMIVEEVKFLPDGARPGGEGQPPAQPDYEVPF
jgi:single-strand DNA-binding protein